MGPPPTLAGPPCDSTRVCVAVCPEPVSLSWSIAWQRSLDTSGGGSGHEWGVRTP